MEAQKHDSKSLIESFVIFAKENKLEETTLLNLLEQTFRAVLKKKYLDDSNFEIIINLKNKDLQIWRYRTIVEDNSPLLKKSDKISLSEAKKIEEDFEVGEQVADEIVLTDFGRRTISIARQTLKSAMTSLHADLIYKKYKDRVGDLIFAEILHTHGKELILADEDKLELVLPKNQQISREKYIKGSYIKVVIDRIENLGEKSTRIILSRSSDQFLLALFEEEIPEVKEGIIEIKGIAREAGFRSKVLVKSYNENVDPVGACIGPRGSRISALSREVCNEAIDVVNTTDSYDLLITRLFNPAKPSYIEYESEDKISVYFTHDQISRAIGSKGINVKLISRLLGKEIDIHEVDESE